MKIVLSLLYFTLISINIYAQGCQNNIQYPGAPVIAPQNFDTVTISGDNFAGDFAELTQFVSGETYIFTSDSINDLITLRSPDQSIVLAFGTQPLMFTVDTSLNIMVHFNTQGCGDQISSRTTQVIHYEEIILPKVGINTNQPLAALDINGTLKISDDVNDPVQGMIRYNQTTKDFEGYDGNKWKSFTKPLAIWGKLRAPIATTDNCFKADDGTTFDYFGQEIDIDDEWAAIAAPIQDIGNNGSQGSVYMLKWNGESYVFDQKITSPIGNSFDKFGTGGVDISGDHLIVGIPDDNHLNSAGSAEIFHLSNGTWSWVSTFGNSHPNFDYHFGQDVAINDSHAAIRNLDLVNGIDEIFVYKKEGVAWVGIDTLISPSNSGTFGSDLAFYDDDLYVGDPDYFDAQIIGGAIHIYSIDANDNVILDDVILNPANAQSFNDNFGVELDLDNDKMIVSSKGHEGSNNLFRAGRAYIFIKENGIWSLEHTLEENPPTEGSDYGLQVSIHQDQAIVTTSIFLDSPKAYVYKYENDDWRLESILMSDVHLGNDFFGFGAEISDNIIMIGASRADIGSNMKQGKVHVFCK